MVKTIPLTGNETSVTGLDGAHAHVRNDGAEIIYAAKSAGLSAGADGVIAIPAGNAAALYGISGAVYISGAGAATVVTSDYVESPFKTSAQAGGSGADEVARAAISAHAGNTEVHVTAEEKAAWNGKAEVSDISNPNLLINPDFAVNQRGQQEYTSGYCADCWKIITTNTKVTMLPVGVKVGFNLDTSSVAVIGQVIEDYSSLAGKEVTVSVFVAEKNSEKTMLSVNYLLNGTRQFKTKPISNGINTFSITVPAAIEDLQIWIYGGDTRTGFDTSDSYIIVEWAKLEVSDKATRYTQPGYADNLHSCQRYYQIRSTGDIAAVDMRPTMATIKDIKQRSDGTYEYTAEL